MAATWGLSFQGAYSPKIDILLNGGSFLKGNYEFRLHYLAITHVSGAVPWINSDIVAIKTNLNSAVPFLAMFDANVFTSDTNTRIVRFPEVWYKAVIPPRTTHASFEFINPAKNHPVSLMQIPRGSRSSSEASDFVVLRDPPRDRPRTPTTPLSDAAMPQVTFQVLFRPSFL